jgi:hypothetical protein
MTSPFMPDRNGLLGVSFLLFEYLRTNQRCGFVSLIYLFDCRPA